MADTVVEDPQIYLITPAKFELAAFSETLQRVLDTREIGCVRLDMPGAEAGDIAQAADLLRDICHQRDVALVIADHFRMVGVHGLDGVHLSDPRAVRDVRRELGADAIVGAFCGSSRHVGMNAGEGGADYVTFGPTSPDPLLGDGSVVDLDLFDWWSKVVEVPVVAEGGLTPELVAKLTPLVDFFAVGREIWSEEDPVAAMQTLGLPRGD